MLRLLCCFSTDPAFKSSLSSAQRATCQLKLARFSASLFLAVFCSLFPLIAPAQTGFLDFNTPGQYTKNFNPSDAGTPDGNYSFAESPTAGVGGSGGVSVFQSSDTTAVYTNRSWDFSVNGARLFLSTLVKANGQSSGNKVQLGILNENNNALNNNAGVAFESFRFIPTSATDWSVRE